MRSLASYRLVWLVAIPAILIVIGTAGYQIVEGWDFSDSLYMTVITLTTVGYREVRELSPAGRVFTMLLSLVGIFMIFYAAMEAIRAIVSGEARAILGRPFMDRSLSTLSNHLVVCGFGRMGRLICKEFSKQQTPFVVIEKQAPLLEDFRLPHGVALPGDATSDEVLRRAGVERARALIAVLGSDADNLLLTMSARLLNDKLFIVARAEDEPSESKLTRGGANRVVSPYVIGGTRIAQAILRPAVVDFIELATRIEHLALQIEETRIIEGSKLAGATIKDSGLRKDLGLIIVAIKKPGGHMLFNPPPDAVMQAGDTLIALGDRPHLDQMEVLAKG